MHHLKIQYNNENTGKAMNTNTYLKHFRIPIPIPKYRRYTIEYQIGHEFRLLLFIVQLAKADDRRTITSVV